MTTPQILVLDIDRTLLTNDYRLLPEVVSAVLDARRAGFEIVLATARSPLATMQIARTLCVDGPVICFNGAWTGTLAGSRTPKAISSFSMNFEAAVQFITIAEGAGLNPCWYTETGWFALSEGQLVEQERRATGLEITLSDIPGTSADGILKMQCLGRPGIDAHQIIEPHAKSFAVTRSDVHLFEITAPEVSKKTAVVAMAKSCSRDANDFCAIGDSENDLSLIEWAGTGIAMGNATDPVKAVANKITKSNEEAGVAHAIAWLLETRAIKMQERCA